MNFILNILKFNFNGRGLKLFFWFPAFFLILCSCTTFEPPYSEYNSATVALKFAKEYRARQYAAKYYYKAESSYKSAMNLYKLKKYEKSKRFFDVSIRMSKKAERISRLKQFKEGEPIP